MATDKQRNIENPFTGMKQAYRHLILGSESLLRLNKLSWTEKLLLKLVRKLYSQRISQLEAVLPKELGDSSLASLNESMMEASVEAALGGHDLGQWEQVENGWQAACKLCHMTSWVGDHGLRYSLLEDSCPDLVEADS